MAENKQPGKLKIAFLDVGQGDTIVVSNPDKHGERAKASNRLEALALWEREDLHLLIPDIIKPAHNHPSPLSHSSFAVLPPS